MAGSRARAKVNTTSLRGDRHAVLPAWRAGRDRRPASPSRAGSSCAPARARSRGRPTVISVGPELGQAEEELVGDVDVGDGCLRRPPSASGPGPMASPPVTMTMLVAAVAPARTRAARRASDGRGEASAEPGSERPARHGSSECERCGGDARKCSRVGRRRQPSSGADQVQAGERKRSLESARARGSGSSVAAWPRSRAPAAAAAAAITALAASVQRTGAAQRPAERQRPVGRRARRGSPAPTMRLVVLEQDAAVLEQRAALAGAGRCRPPCGRPP